MINIEVNDYTASVTAKGETRKLVTETFGLLIESFKLLRKLNEEIYEKTKEDLFIAILSGALDSAITENGGNYDGSEMRVDLKELKKQLEQKEEEG